MDYNKLIKETADYVEAYMDQYDLSKLKFHNGIHTKEVVKAVEDMAKHYKLSEQDRTIVILSAYFHDLGYCGSVKEEHEIRSADLAASFLREKKVDSEVITTVRGCILATKMPQSPQNILEEIVCDADLYHFGSDWFDIRNKLMRQEAGAYGYGSNKEDWRNNTIKLMESHRYHTEYGKKILEEKKQKNIELLKEREEKDMELLKEKDSLTETNGLESKKNSKRPNRGIETMFRITSTNNQRLSDMADNKSNILITVNSIILSVVISLLLRKLDNNAHLVLPTAVLLLTSLATMVIAILATRPSIPDGLYTEQDLKEKSKPFVLW